MTGERQLAERIADRLGEIDGVVAVALGGSWARATARPDSDLDVGFYQRNRPSAPAFRHGDESPVARKGRALPLTDERPSGTLVL